MFRRDTVFILGAGASWHYGFPTGEDLVERVKWVLSKFIGHFYDVINSNVGGVIYNNEIHPEFIKRQIHSSRHPNQNIFALYQQYIDDAYDLINALDSAAPLVIDYLLPHISKHDVLAKIGISWALADCAARYHHHKYNINRMPQLFDADYSPSSDDQKKFKDAKDNWVRFILHHLTLQIAADETLADNKVTFVSFNYDMSLERALYNGLKAHQVDEDKIKEFLSEDRFIHVYGKVGPDYMPDDFIDIATYKAVKPTTRSDGNVEAVQQWIEWKQRWNNLLNQVYTASLSLRTVSGLEKALNEAAINSAISAIQSAERVYILGYGFDESNNQRLKLENLQPNEEKRRCVYFTNYGDQNQINKKASRLFFRTPERFPVGRSIESSTPDDSKPGPSYYFEKSVRDTYGSLGADFDSFDASFL